jgi:hypothetical protein
MKETSEKIVSLKNEFKTLEEFGIKEKEFQELFQFEPVYSLA